MEEYILSFKKKEKDMLRKKGFLSVFMGLTMVVTLTLGSLSSVFSAVPDTDYTIINPYETVDWANYGQFKADFHSHTIESDGGNTPKEMIEDHYRKGFDILAITDHNFVNTTWDRTDRPGVEYLTTERLKEINEGVGRDGRGMIGISYADEQSRSDHLNTFWTDFNNASGATLESNIAKADELGGISHINHPGRYTGGAGRTDAVGVLASSYPITILKYVNLFSKYASLTGMEIVNKKDGDSASDRILWDNILKQTMPERNVWGYSNDDTHSVSATGFSYNMMLMPENTEENVRTSMEKGTFYAVAKVAYRELGANFVSVGETPAITDIVVDQNEDSITIEGNHYNTIEWVADGNIIATGNTIDLDNYDDQINNYVRAQLKGEGGISFTQAFGVTGGDVKEAAPISTVAITADANTVTEQKGVQLKAQAYDESGNLLDLSNAMVVYNTDAGNALSISEDGYVTLKSAPIANMNVKVWAEVISGMQLIKSSELTLKVDVGATGNYTIGYITDGRNDVEEFTDNGEMYFDSSDLEIVWESPRSANVDNQAIGLRYINLDIPKGAKITNAYLQFTVDEANKSLDPFNVSIYAEQTDDSGPFTEEAYNVSSRLRTDAFSVWKDIPLWTKNQEAGEAQRTSDLSAVIQEVVNRGGWASGNAMTFILVGEGNRTAESYEGGKSEQAPVLHVLYEMPEPEVSDMPLKGTDMVKKARELNITPGKLNLISKLIEAADGKQVIKYEDWKDKSVQEIQAATKAFKKADR